MQNVYISPGTALCRFCGDQFSTYRLAAHVAKAHPRPGPVDTSPTLVRKRAPFTEPPPK